MNHATLLQQENELLKQQLREKETQLNNKNNYIVRLEELIKQFQRKQFSSSSEKAPPNQHDLFNEAESIDLDAAEQQADDTTEVKAHQRTKKPRVSIPAEWPREEVIYDLPAEQKVCPHDGAALTEMGSQTHEQLDIIPAQINVIKHVRKQYACPCCKTYIAIADKPKQPLEKSIASASLLAYVATHKYCDAVPLYRQSEMFKRIGIELDRTNLANWMVQCGPLIQPLINVLLDCALCHTQPFVHLDETTVQVLNEPGKSAQSKSYMWVLVTSGEQPVRLFHYAATRSQAVPMALLTKNVNAMMVDGYEGYQQACDQYDIQRLGCWAHARRKFVEAQKLQPKGKTGRADQALAFIQKLYRIEHDIKNVPPDERHRIREQHAKPIIDKIETWLTKSITHVPPKTALGKALHYLHQQWPRLIGYLDDGRYPIDNNAAENAIRPFVIGRKNWLFSHSQAGAKASANLYSLIETAKANGLNPYEYLKHVFKELPNALTVEDIEQLLPWQYKALIDNT